MLRKTFRTGSRAFRQEPWQAEKLTDIGTRSIFNEDHDMFRESVRRWFQVNKQKFDIKPILKNFLTKLLT